MFLEPVRKHRAPSDDVSLGVRLGLIVAVAVALFGILAFRLWFLQVLSGDHYVVLADNNRTRVVAVPAPRGVIYDRQGKAMVENRAGLTVGILPMDLRDEDIVLPRLATLLHVPEEEIRAKLARGEANPYVVVPIKDDVSETPVVAYLKEHSLEFPGVRVEKTSLREYPLARAKTMLAAHVLGFVGEISDAELGEDVYRGLKPGDQIGKDGIEQQYDSYLRGTDGNRTVEVDFRGRPKRVLEEVDPQPGKNLVTTIDSTVQAAAEKAVNEGILRARAAGFKEAAAGAVVALDPKTGEILAMASYPSYSPTPVGRGYAEQDLQGAHRSRRPRPAAEPRHHGALSGGFHLQAVRGRHRAPETG